MIDITAADQLLDFNARLASPVRARQQLEGAVALHNILERESVAYLADEVGMGKTLVALGALALFRHYQPHFRVLVVAPKENLQLKWAKELRVFAHGNVRFPDLRVRGIGRAPARPHVQCNNLMSLVRETTLDPDRDFFCRLPSFSFQMGKEDEDWYRVRKQLREYLPWLSDEALALQGHRARKDNLARAICCALPVFDLVIVDEAHNLKHGFSESSSARNRVLGLALGHPDGNADAKLYPGYGARAKRVLFLSATPIEDSYHQLWNQFAVFGRGGDFKTLGDAEASEEAKKKLAERVLIRRVTTIRTQAAELTKNQYRREWRLGGVSQHDEPTKIEDARQRLTLALVQKKVSEVLADTRFNHRFQIGMLASFESFLVTAKVKTSDEEASNFDDSEQTLEAEEREGIDVHDLNRLARSHRERFDREMPHPKMDALVSDLQRAWNTGRKALVFVRRVASVKEICAKLEETYDAWLQARLRNELPASVQVQLERAFERYREYRADTDSSLESSRTFYSWFFHGDGPRGVLSGAAIARRFTQTGTVYSTFFEDNDAAALLGVLPGDVLSTLARVLSRDKEELRECLRIRSARFYGSAKKFGRSERFYAAQAAVVELLRETVGPWKEQAQAVWDERYQSSPRNRRVEAPELGEYLELRTFFTELRARPQLRAAIWPASVVQTDLARFQEESLRAQLLASAARLGHAFIDFYVLTISQLGTLESGTHAELSGDAIDEYLDLLDAQRLQSGPGPWRAFAELASIAKNFDLILDVNAPELRSTPLGEATQRIGTLLGQQHPIGGMAGSVNQSLLRQFRMPGYPFALVTTDLLQEGEDLHPFCAAVYHYGISWTPSAMEQRIGRIDRVRSQTDRHLSDRETTQGDDFLQVYFPHLADSVEVLQVRRVLSRMNTFLRLMHQGLSGPDQEGRRLDVQRDIVAGLPPVEHIKERLESAFPIRAKDLTGSVRELAVDPGHSDRVLARFEALRHLIASSSGCHITWEPSGSPALALGTVQLGARQQPFALYLRTLRERVVVRCVSPVGRVRPAVRADALKRLARELGARIGAVKAGEEESYDLVVEDDVLLGANDLDATRVAHLVDRITNNADRLEQELLASDQPLAEFKDDLMAERRLDHEP